MIKIYIYGCTTCGTRAVGVSNVKQYATAQGEDVQIINSLYDTADREAHAQYLQEADLPSDKYDPVVILPTTDIVIDETLPENTDELIDELKADKGVMNSSILIEETQLVIDDKPTVSPLIDWL